MKALSLTPDPPRSSILLSMWYHILLATDICFLYCVSILHVNVDELRSFAQFLIVICSIAFCSFSFVLNLNYVFVLNVSILDIFTRQSTLNMLFAKTEREFSHEETDYLSSNTTV